VALWCALYACLVAASAPVFAVAHCVAPVHAYPCVSMFLMPHQASYIGVGAAGQYSPEPNSSVTTDTVVHVRAGCEGLQEP
jgi:hypothetical protein